nr:hypothetical protein [uncultured Ruminococcus sp.]
MNRTIGSVDFLENSSVLPFKAHSVTVCQRVAVCIVGNIVTIDFCQLILPACIGVLVCITMLCSCRITVVWIKSLFIFILQISCSVIRIVNVELIYIIIFFFKLVKTVISVLVYEFAVLLNLSNIAVVIIRIIVG